MTYQAKVAGKAYAHCAEEVDANFNNVLVHPDGVSKPMEPPKAEFKQRYLIAIVGAVILILVTLIPAFPLFLKAFVPFPKLEDATYLEGTLEVEGEFAVSGVRVPRYYVVNTSGRYEFLCGYMRARHGCFANDSKVHGHDIKIWYSTLFGVLQYEITPQPKKRYLARLSSTYADAKEYFESDEYADQWKKYKSVFFAPGVLFLFLCWLIHRHLQVRRETLEAGAASSLPSSNSSKD